MSNYSKFMICWPSIDEEVHDQSAARATEIIEKYKNTQYGRVEFIVSGGPCDKDCAASTMACETVVVGSANYLSPEDMIKILRSLKWQYPEDVELFCKHEEQDSYQRYNLESEIEEDT